jgi:hypothetical protein
MVACTNNDLEQGTRYNMAWGRRGGGPTFTIDCNALFVLEWGVYCYKSYKLHVLWESGIELEDIL